MTACVVTVAVSALAAGLLLHAGFCPSTIQMLIVAAILLMAYRQKSPVSPAVEHMENSIPVENDLFDPPVKEMLVHRLEPMRGGMTDLKTVTDHAANSQFDTTELNTRDDVMVLIAPWNGPSSDTAGVFDNFTIAVTCTIPEAGMVSLFMAEVKTKDVLSKVELFVQPSGSKRAIQLKYGGATISQEVAATKEPVTIICRRSGLKVTMSQTVHSMVADRQGGDQELPDTARVNPQVTSPMVVGAVSSGGYTHVSRLLIWKAALSDTDVNAVIRQGLMTYQLKEEIYRSLVAERDTAYQAAVNAKTRNPYGSDQVQAACSASIPDWTRPDALAKADPSCWDAISATCIANPKLPGCECWDPAKASTDTCKKFLATMSKAAYSDVSNLSPEQLKAVVEKYKLVDPSKVAAAEAEKAAAAAAAAASAAATKPTVARSTRRRSRRYDDELDFDEEERRLMTPGYGWFGGSSAYDMRDGSGRYGPSGREWKWWWPLIGRG